MKNLARLENGFRWKMNLDAIIKNYTKIIGPVLDMTRPYAGKVVFYRGEQSSYIQPEDVAGIKALFPQAEVISVPDADHWVHVDNRDFLLRSIQSKLAEPR